MEVFDAGCDPSAFRSRSSGGGVSLVGLGLSAGASILIPRLFTEPQAILDELKLVLEEDAAVFMVKMWRMLVFCTLRAQERTQS